MNSLTKKINSLPALVGMVFLLSVAAHAATYTVTNTNDSGAGSLRQAITDANKAGGSNQINFNIPGNSVQVIDLLKPLPDISSPVTINGYTQPGATANTLAKGDNAVLRIQLNGTALPAGSSGLTLRARSSVSGLVLVHFGSAIFMADSSDGSAIRGCFVGVLAQGTSAGPNNAGIVVNAGDGIIGGLSPADRNVISGNTYEGIGLSGYGTFVEGNYIGTDRSGTAAIGNTDGVVVDAASSESVGGAAPGAGNVISGNKRYGVLIADGGDDFSSSTNNQVLGNLIGTQADGGSALGNGDAGVRIEGSNHNSIGGAASGAANVIAFNGASPQGVPAGVSISDYSILNRSTNNPVLRNSIYSNAGLGIDLSRHKTDGDGVTANDANDADAGPNNLQNYPVITSAFYKVATGSVNISASLNTEANKLYAVEAFASDQCDASGYGEGQKYLGTFNVASDANGFVNLNVGIGANLLGKYLTMTATDPAGNTSEFSNCAQIVVAPPGAIQFGLPVANVYEDAGSMTLTLARTGGSGGAVSVQYATADGTAKAGSDYTATSGTLTWADGDPTGRTITIPLTDDAIPEGAETFFVTLSNPTGGATLGNPSTVTVNLADARPSISISDVTKAEGNGGTTAFTFNVALSSAYSNDITVNYSTADGTAGAGSDYQPTSGALTIFKGETVKPVTVQVNGDTQQEPDETFFVNLSNAVNATISKAQGTGTITNDDAAPTPTPAPTPGNATVQFSAANYSVTEGTPHADITVTRTGDASASGGVDYATVEAAVVPCSVNNGLASDRCDYNTTIGTLHFAAGETTKSFQIIITDDAYAEGAETAQLALSHATGGVTLGLQSTATLTILDNDASDGAVNPADQNPFFVGRQYVDFLNREADAGGANAWLATLDGCGPTHGAGGSPADCDRVQVSSGFYRSPEFNARGFFVYRFYEAALGRLPSYREFVRDAQSLNGGATAAETEARRLAFIDDFTQRAEFTNAYAGLTGAATAAQFVGKLEVIAGVQVGEPSRSQLVARMQAGELSAAQTLRAFVESDEVQSRFYNRAFVAMEYFGYLRRAPEQGGFNAWLQFLDANPQDYRTMVNGFVNSTEYRLRFGKP
jgi:hypothetical protein